MGSMRVSIIGLFKGDPQGFLLGFFKGIHKGLLLGFFKGVCRFFFSY